MVHNNTQNMNIIFIILLKKYIFNIKNITKCIFNIQL